MANYMYLTDASLPSKITAFRAKGINDNIIKDLLEKGLLTGTLEDITRNLEIIETNNGGLTEENLYLIKKDLTTYYKRVELLRSLGIELDTNELRNYLELLIHTPYLEDDIEVLKQYMVRIVRKNGKYALDIFWKKPSELIRTLDDMIEANLENIIVNNPEVIGLDTTELLKRVKYCENNGISVYNREKESAENYIVSPLDFARTYPEADLETISSYDNNKNLTSVIGNNDYLDILIDALNAYYQNSTLPTIEVSEEEKEDNRVITEIFEKNFGVETLSPNTYSISEIPISKKKVERNLVFLTDFINKEGRSLQGLEKEIILLAILHNLKVDEDTMLKIVNSGMGFNQSVGGPTI